MGCLELRGVEEASVEPQREIRKADAIETTGRSPVAALLQLAVLAAHTS